MSVTPWWECLSLRSEIAKAGGNINDVQMSLFSAVHERESTEYGEVGYYSDITFPTRGLVELMGSMAVRLASPSNAGSVKAVWRGDQGMGGGKSHAQVGLFHMASQPEAFFATDLGKRVAAEAKALSGEDVPTDLNRPAVVVLPCDRMDPFKADKKLDNVAETLGQRWLWRLVDGDLNKYHDYADDLGTPDGIKRAMQAVGRPVLTLVDEVLNYIRKVTDDESRAQQDMAFLRDLMEATNTSPHAALVIVMIASDEDTVAMGALGERIRTELEGMLSRYGRSIATTSGGDFADIIRRRLFENAPPAEVTTATVNAFKQNAIGGWEKDFDTQGWWTDGFTGNVTRAYPFHPALIDLVEREWANRAGFQKVRSTIQIFAATVHLWFTRAKQGEWVPPLIGLGDLPLSDTKVRQSLLDSGVIPDQKNTTNFREIAANDVVDTDDQRGAARRIDVDRSFGLLAQINPRVAERIATGLWLLSLAPRSQGAIGATDAELRIAGFVPDAACELAEVDAVLTTLQATDGKGLSTLDVRPGRGGNPRRLVMSTTQTLQMFFKTQRASVEQDGIDEVLREFTQNEIQAGPFDRAVFVSAQPHLDAGVKGDALTNALLKSVDSAGLDAAENRLVVLDPTAFTLLNGVDSETRIAVSAALGLGKPEEWSVDLDWPTPLSVAYASSCIFALVNTQRRGYAVAAATDYIAWQRVAEIANVAADEDLSYKAKGHISEKREDLRRYLRRAFQHLVYLGEGRVAATAKLEQDNQTALDGDTVWAVLDEREKVFGQGQFDHTALLFQMEDRYWSKSLASLRADFYRSPRLPLLHGGDSDLKNALFAAARQTEPNLMIKDSVGDVVEPGKPGDIQLSNNFTLERPAVEVVPDPPVAPPTGAPVDTSTPTGPTSVSTPSDGTTFTPPVDTGTDQAPVAPPATPPPPAAEKRVVVSLTGSAFDTEAQRMGANELFSTLIDAIDRGDATYGKFQMEFIVAAEHAGKLTRAAEELGASAHDKDV